MAARIAARVAAASPSGPISRTYAQEIGRIDALPHGAAETGPIHPSMPLAPVHPLRPGRVVAARTPVSAGWQQSSVVGLDDEDIGFAEIDVYAPARVVNG